MSRHQKNVAPAQQGENFGAPARQWFVPGDGIDRTVITADIQRYLGNDATVRPGPGTGEYEGVQGFWIRAYRNLTTAMITDLRLDSEKWVQEQRRTGTRAPYVHSYTYQESNATAMELGRHRDSPSLEGPYPAPPLRDRPDPRDARDSRDLRDPRRGLDRQPDVMQIDQPPVPAQRYGGQPGRPYPPEARDYQDERMYEPQPDRIPVRYPQDMPMADPYARPPVNAPFGQEQEYGANQPYNDGAPPGYVRQGNFYVPIASSHVQPGVSAVSRPEPPYGQQPPQGYNRDQRDYRDQQRGPPRDSAYEAYPSPAATVSSVTQPRDREPILSPSQPSPQGFPLQYDQYGRPIPVPGGYPYDPNAQFQPAAPRTPPREAVDPRQAVRGTANSRQAPRESANPRQAPRESANPRQGERERQRPADEEKDSRRRRRN